MKQRVPLLYKQDASNSNCKRFQRALNQSKTDRPTLRALIHSNEGLTPETSVFESFTVANLPYQLVVDNLI